MSTRSALRRLPPPTALLSSRTPPHARHFFALPTASPQVLSATRHLPYPSASLYEIIANVDSYSAFVPYCQLSRVTNWASDTAGRRWPTQADLRVGWGGFEETFTSSLRCVPGKSVEAVSGSDGAGGAVFKSLVTRWTVQPVKTGTGTDVDLVIKFQFTNPLYSAVSAAVSDKVAAVMIEAFEKEARRVLGPAGTHVQKP